ncbi:alanine racemase [Ruminococcaceae bacterium OttesenSCG-928-I18]|nr:alanine racemase [Ruminococcaceae bacterium OttesenSCG-928-I18]
MDNLSEKYRVWVEVDLDKLCSNYRQMAKRARAKVMPVVKADAYGHGAVRVAKTLQAEEAVRQFAVVTQEEAIALRKGGVEGLVLLMGIAPKDSIPALQTADITLCVPNLEIAKRYSDAAQGKPLKIHLKLDTGMGRLGMREENAIEESLAIAQLPGLHIEGIFTQMSSSDLPGEDPFTMGQYECFKRVIEALEEKGLSIPLHHCANSAATMGFDGIHWDMVRNGLSLYGYQSREEDLGIELRPILSWGSSIVQCKTVPGGASVGYDRGYKAEGEKRIATVPLGYADGLSHGLSLGKGAFLVRGKKAPIVGKICMDMCMLDVTGIEGAQPGDLVTVLGEDGPEMISADDLAGPLDTISYEILCGIGKRVPRLYRQKGVLEKDTPYWCGYEG